MLNLQYDFFENIETEESLLRKEFNALKEAHNKLRRRYFAEKNDLARMFICLKSRVDFLENALR